MNVNVNVNVNMHTDTHTDTVHVMSVTALSTMSLSVSMPMPVSVFVVISKTSSGHDTVDGQLLRTTNKNTRALKAFNYKFSALVSHLNLNISVLPLR